MKLLQKYLPIYCTAIFLAVGHSNLFAEEQDSIETNFNMNEITCWDLSTVKEDVAAYAVTMLYGYYSGIKGIAEHDGSKIENKLKALGAICEENPDLTAIQALKMVK